MGKTPDIDKSEYRLVTKDVQKSRSAFEWIELIEIYKDGKSDYYFFRRSPFCMMEGYRERMNEVLTRRGWKCGMAGLTYREKLSYEELIKAMTFKRSYEDVYEGVVSGDWLKTISLTLPNFINLVDIAAEVRFGRMMKAYGEDPRLKDPLKIQQAVLRNEVGFSLDLCR